MKKNKKNKDPKLKKRYLSHITSQNFKAFGKTTTV